MTNPRHSTAATTWLAASGLIASASVIGTGVTSDVANALQAQPSNCPAGTFLVSTRVCELYVTSSTSWNVPSSVTTLQILSVGGGGGGGGGSTYAPGGGGGGATVRVCTTSLVDLSHHVTIFEGEGGAGGANGAAYLYDSQYGSEHADPGANGAATRVIVGNAQVVCLAPGGQGGAPGYHYLASGLPTTPYYGGGGNSGSGVLGGSAAGLEVGNDTSPCILTTPLWEYNVVASGGAGAQVGQTASATVSGNGGNGTSVTSGMFANFGNTYAGGGGGGSGYDCHARTTAGAGGSGGGGAGGSNGSNGTTAVSGHGAVVFAAQAGAANSGSGGGGGSGTDLSTQASVHGVGVAGATGGSGIVVIRFAEPTLNTNAYFATASSVLTNGDKTALAAFVTNAVADNMTSVTVEGFTDPRGTVPDNQALSTARAKSTAAYLRQLFAAQHKAVTITAVGKGEKFTYANLALDRVAMVSAQGGTVNTQV